ncbi:MAG TPA: glycosyltransferase 87 family protein, partial [Propionicimonas sp.]
MSNTAPALSTFLGGAIGRHARRGGIWFNPTAWAFLTLTVSWLVLMLRQIPCIPAGDKFPRMCYSDITVLYYWRGLKDGQIPYLDSDVEYPVLTGGFMEFSRRILLLLGGQSRPGLSGEEVTSAAGLYFGINAVLLFALFGVLVWAHLKMHRPWDAMMIAAAPAIWTTGLINWDALVVALTSLALLAWARKKPVWAGVWLGLGIAAKLYPVLLLVPLAVLCIRTGKWRPFFITLGATVVSWVAVNLPVYLATPDGWMGFWTFN